MCCVYILNSVGKVMNVSGVLGRNLSFLIYGLEAFKLSLIYQHY